MTFKKFLAVATSLAFCWVLMSGTAAKAGGIAVVDLDSVLENSTKGKDSKQQLEDLQNRKQREIDLLRESIQKIQEELETRRYVLTDEELITLRSDYEKKMLELQRSQTNAASEIQRATDELLQSIYGEMKGIIEKLGKERGYDMILNKQDLVTVYTSDAIDLTDEVLQLYEKETAAGNAGGATPPPEG